MKPRRLLGVSFRILMFVILVMAVSMSFGKGPDSLRRHAREAFHLRFQVNAATGIPINVLWDYDFSQPLNKPCTTAVTTSCVSSFNIEVLTGTTISGPLQTLAVPATQTAVLTTGLLVPYNGPATLGTYIMQVQVMFKDSTGTVNAGPTAQAPVPLIPSAVLNLRAQ